MELLLTLLARALWRGSHSLPRVLLRKVPQVRTLLSAVNFYFYAQALGLLWTFGVSLLAACATGAVEAAGRDDASTRWPVSLLALVYVYYSVLRILMLSSETMWMVMWESYHDYPTMRLMLLGPRENRAAAFAGVPSTPAQDDSPSLQVSQQIFQRQVSPREAYNKVYILRRQVLLATPLVLLLCFNVIMLLGQGLCEGHLDGVCRKFQCFNPTGRFNRNARFVLFVALMQWVQAWTGLFPDWHRAILSSRSWMALALQASLIMALVPGSALRFGTWLLRPAGTGVAQNLVFGFRHFFVDAVLVTGWSIWLLVASVVILSRECLRKSGFSVRKIADEPVWCLLSSSFKLTQTHWVLLAWIRGCVKLGFAHAQSDFIFITILYPWLMVFIWTATFILIAFLRNGPRIPLVLLGMASGFVASLGTGWLVCALAGRSDCPLLIVFVGVHLGRQAFNRSRELLRERKRQKATLRGGVPTASQDGAAPPVDGLQCMARRDSALSEPDSQLGAAARGHGFSDADEFSRVPSRASVLSEESPTNGGAPTPEPTPIDGCGLCWRAKSDTGGSGSRARAGGEPPAEKSWHSQSDRGLSTAKSATSQPKVMLRSVTRSVSEDFHALEKDLLRTSVTERRWAAAAFQTLVLICLTFVGALTAILVLGGVQQRVGLVIEDVVTWSPVSGGIEIVNSAVSRLRLARAAASGDRPAGDAETSASRAALQTGQTQSYALCGHSWYGLSLLDYTMLAGVSYMTPTVKNDIPGLMSQLLPHKQAVLRKTPTVVRRWLEFEIRSCNDELSNSSSCFPVTVIAISGTDPTRIQDYAENLRMWTEPVALQILSTLFPTVRTWPREATAVLIGFNRDVLREMSMQDDRWHYQEILEHVARKPAEEKVVLTGHSLGGGMALVVGALTGRLAVAVQPPGVYHSLAKHQSDRRVSGSGAVHQRSVTLKFEGDWVQHFDDHGGLVQTMSCDRSHQGMQLACHMIEGAVCHLLQHCGDEEQRFASCTHEYAPASAVRTVLSTALAWMRRMWDNSRWTPAELFNNMGPKVTTALCISVVPILLRGGWRAAAMDSGCAVRL